MLGRVAILALLSALACDADPFAPPRIRGLTDAVQRAADSVHSPLDIVFLAWPDSVDSLTGRGLARAGLAVHRLDPNGAEIPPPVSDSLFIWARRPQLAD